MADVGQKIPQELLINLAKAARIPLYDVLKEEGYTMPSRYNAEYYDPNYEISGLDNMLYGMGSSSPNYASKKLIQDLEKENIIAYLTDRKYIRETDPDLNPDLLKGLYKEGAYGAPDTAFVYETPMFGEDFLKEYEAIGKPTSMKEFLERETELREIFEDKELDFPTGQIAETLMHEAFLHGVGGRHDRHSLDDLGYHGEANYPFYGTQLDYDKMERKLSKELVDTPEMIKLYLELDRMLPKNQTVEDYPDIQMDEIEYHTYQDVEGKSLLDSLYKPLMKNMGPFLQNIIK